MCLLKRLAFLWQNFLNIFLFLYQFCQILKFFSKCPICKPVLVTNRTWPPPDLQAFWGPYLNCTLFDHSFKHVSLMSQAVLLLTLLHIQGSHSCGWHIYMWLWLPWFPCRDFKALFVRSHQSLWLWIRSCDLQAKNEKGHDFKAMGVRSYQSLWLWIRSCDLQAKN